MVDYTYIRVEKGLYWSRVIQLIFTFIILGLAGDNASGWHSLGCTTPSKLSVNIACINWP